MPSLNGWIDPKHGSSVGCSQYAPDLADGLPAVRVGAVQGNSCRAMRGRMRLEVPCLYAFRNATDPARPWCFHIRRPHDRRPP